MRTLPNGELGMCVSTLPAHPDVTLLRAALGAGALAILNLESVPRRFDIDAALAALSREKNGRFGVRLVGRASVDLIQPRTLASFAVVVVTADTLSEMPHLLGDLRAAGCEVLLECTTVDQARLGAELRVDGLIAKGHESGGRVGEETTFVLVQRVIAESSLPVWAQGGIATDTAAACFVAGCAGVVLDAQFALATESTLPEPVKQAVARMGGDETICLGSELDCRYRVHRRPALEAVEELQRIEAELADSTVPIAERQAQWREAVNSRINWRTAGQPLWPLGQDAAFAGPLARKFRSVSGILAGFEDAVRANVEIARRRRPLDRDAPLARAHGTAYPILQGPMTRVSDVAEFAAAVAKGGALPFLALALLRAPQVRSLLQETKQLLADRPWGVGILGFVPVELREEQLAVIQEFAPRFAIIAGGRPDQAAKLEAQGTATYLHVPAPALLKMFLANGARRFIFEGRECGGHVGPRTSFVLWQSAIATIAEAVDGGVPAEQIHAVFAGGIHDARSAAMVAAMAAPLEQRGVRIGVLLGTAYLFTQEAVESGAIVETFQREAVECRETVLLESGPGHATRCANTAFYETFRATRRQLIAEGRSPDEIRSTLEMLNLGRLRIASKAVRREPDAAANATPPVHVRVGVDDQRRDGMYMIGQIAAARTRVCSIADLHVEVAVGGTKLLQQRKLPSSIEMPADATAALSSNVAIVGMGCLMPQAQNVRALWSNLLNRRDAITEIPAERFDVTKYFDPDRHARDRIYSKWGGFLDEVPFDPIKHGIPPAAIPSIDPFQLLTLEVVQQALADAGYADRPFDRERTSVILGASGGVGDLGFRYGVRAGLPAYGGDVSAETLSRLPEWTEDSFAGILLNVAAGRVANRLDLGGLNFTVDAACASSLAALFLAARELESRASDMVIVGGIDTVNSPFGYLCFSSAQALSPRGRCRTFDDSADGIAISEGLAVLVLKRLSDAERDGDRIYAVIRAVAGSSDGRGKGLTAPRPDGQKRALERAYAAANISPASITLVEAHGTGTVAGDGAEVAALSDVFTRAGAPPKGCAIGSIKSMVGHTKAAAGIAGVLKVALALDHKILPPTLHVTKPNARLREAATPFYVNSEARPWIAPDDEQPRRAAVSSFGFGGTNFHVVVEEYDRQTLGTLPRTAPADEWPAELVVCQGTSPLQLGSSLERIERLLAQAENTSLRTIAAAICDHDQPRTSGSLRLAVVATSVADLRQKLAIGREALQAGRVHLADSRGVYLGQSASRAKVAFLFPGQGSQYPGMHRDLALHFPELRQSLELADRITDGEYGQRGLSSYVFPPPSFEPGEEELRIRELTDTAVAQPALGAVEAGLCRLLHRLGIDPDFAAGHSYGEYVALWCADVFSRETLLALSAARGRLLKQATADARGTMAAVIATPDAIRNVLGDAGGVWIANLNGPRQTVLAGAIDAIERAVAKLGEAGITTRRIPVACAFHSPLVEPARHELAAVIARTPMQAARIPVFSNALGGPYPASLESIKEILCDHLVRPVRFVEQVQAMYDAGARLFVEVGPRAVLSGLARETLAGRDAVVLPVDSTERPGITQLLHALAQAATAGVPIEHRVLFEGRSIERLRLEDVVKPATKTPAHVWMVNGSRARKLAPAPATASTPAPISAPRPASTSASAVPRTATTVHTASGKGRVLNGGSMESQSLPVVERLRSHDETMQQFQQLMSQFLQTQALVMTAYLQGSGARAAQTPAAVTIPELARATSSLEAAPVVAASAVLSLGEPARPRVEAPAPVPVAVVSAHPAPHVLRTAPAAAAPVDVLMQLVRIVADRTGYPEDMLDVDANVEADLGIDSIKRVEVLTAFQQAYAGADGSGLQDAMEKLIAVKTLREMSALLSSLLAPQTEPAVA